ncbi:hypothetical protein FB45DRAFT_298697 [Roridomyces roridus]|uniref:Uncharacterized protein n=1 Tax=Roridomyces roridus TaxID=1738132 RepID=A0AAD7CCE6_9AGAR|nr:hypothetical protein FB45DRAFT_298697 [Roridomyces roridus]
MSPGLVALSKFPGLRSLKLHGWGQVDYESESESESTSTVQALDILPRLELTEYVGAPELLPWFLAKPTLVRLVTHPCTSAYLASQLCGGSTSITSLYARLRDLDLGSLRSICTSLPGLLDLRIEVSSPMTIATNFFFALVQADTPVLPTELQRLAISWDFTGSESRNSESPSPPPNYQAMRGRYPALRKLWLDGEEFLFRFAGGNFEEVDYVSGGVELSRIRDRFSSFWEG